MLAECHSVSRSSAGLSRCCAWHDKQIGQGRITHEAACVHSFVEAQLFQGQKHESQV